MRMTNKLYIPQRGSIKAEILTLQLSCCTTIIKRCQLEINAVTNSRHVLTASSARTVRSIGAVPNLLSLCEADHCQVSPHVSTVLCCKQQTQAALSEGYALNQIPQPPALHLPSSEVLSGTKRCVVHLKSNIDRNYT